MATQILPSAAALDVLRTFESLIEARTQADPNDAYFTADWSGLWQELADGGWTAFADGGRPGEDGDFSLLDLTALAELWGGSLVPLPFVPTLVARRWLAERPEAEVRMSYVVSEQGQALVVHGEHVQQILTGETSVDRQMLKAALELDQFSPSLPISLLGGQVSPAAKAPRRDAAILAAAEAVGAAQKVLRRTVEYASMRQQFGRPIGSFQAVKHRLADLHTRIELSRSAVTWACNEPAAVASASRVVLEHCLRVAEDCVQVHGGIGYTWAAPVHRYFRHIMSLRRIVAAAAWAD